MNNRTLLYALTLTCILLIFGAWTLAFFHYGAAVRQTPAPQALATLQAGPAAEPQFNPPKPQDAPEDIREAVMLGYNIINDTAQYAPEHVGNELACATCHLEGGTQQGEHHPCGRWRQPIRIFCPATVTAQILPKKCRIALRAISMPRPPALDSRTMQAVLAYLHWISKDISRLCQAAVGHARKARQQPQTRCRQRSQRVCQTTAPPVTVMRATVPPPLWGNGACHILTAPPCTTSTPLPCSPIASWPPDAANLTPEAAPLTWQPMWTDSPAPITRPAKSATATGAPKAPQGK